jgi:hypothetical protein
MNITPRRIMFLDGRRVVAGQVEKVSQKAGELALRHGWADEAEESKKSAKKSKDDGASNEGSGKDPD